MGGGGGVRDHNGILLIILAVHPLLWGLGCVGLGVSGAFVFQGFKDKGDDHPDPQICLQRVLGLRVDVHGRWDFECKPSEDHTPNLEWH